MNHTRHTTCLDYTHLDAFIKQNPDFSAAAPQVEIARWAVADARIPRLDQLDFAILQKDGVSQDGVRPQQAVCVVYASVCRLSRLGAVWRVWEDVRWEEGLREHNFGCVLGDMGLNSKRGVRCD